MSRPQHDGVRNPSLIACMLLATALITGGSGGCAGRHVAGPVRATISGTLHEPDAVRAVERRDVVAVNNATGQSFHTRTNRSGAYTFLVPPGTYRLDVVLRGKEVLSTRPSPVTVDAGDIKADVDMVIAAFPR